MTFDGDGVGVGTGTGALGVCGDVDDGIGNDVCARTAYFLTLLCKTTRISIIAAQVIPLNYRKH